MRAGYLAAAAVGVLVSSSAFADGVVTGADFLSAKHGRGREEVPVPVIPDQRTLIAHHDGRETLVIETAFEGHGTEFAWVVPTPSIPKIVEAPDDLFPRLSEATQPALISRVPDLGIAGLVVVAGLVLARHGGRRGTRAAKSLIAGVAALAFLTPGGFPARGGENGVITLGAPAALGIHLPTTPDEAPVSVRQREIVGAFDTVTLAAKEPRALIDWLQVNGYAVPAGIKPVAAQYIRDGWVFNAMRLHRDGDRREAVRIRPLSFTFDVAAPVYPMRLTGVGGSTVRVEMYVAGPDRAEADGFEVPRCARLDFETRHESDRGGVVVPDGAAGRFLAAGNVLTRLDRTFTPEEMKADVSIGFRPFESAQRTVFSERAADAMGWNLGALLAICVFLGIGSAEASARRPARPSRRWLVTAVVVFLAADAALAVVVLAPTVPTRLVSVEHVNR